MARNLKADKEICNKATPGPWENEHTHDGETVFANGEVVCFPYNQYDGIFIAAAREGWPHAIERALKAEAEVESKKNTLDSIYAKTERLWQWARETLTGEVADQFWQISANGQLMKENPEYHQRINGLKYRAEKAEAEVRALRDIGKVTKDIISPLIINENETLKSELARYKRALELACEKLDELLSKDGCYFTPGGDSLDTLYLKMAKAEEGER